MIRIILIVTYLKTFVNFLGTLNILNRLLFQMYEFLFLHIVYIVFVSICNKVLNFYLIYY